MNAIFEKQTQLEELAYEFVKTQVFADNPDECPLYCFKLRLTAKFRESDFEQYKKDLNIFKAMFGANDMNLKKALWNSISRKNISEPYKKDFTEKEYEFLVRAIDARNNHIEIANVNKTIVTERLILRPVESGDKKLFAYHFKKDGDFFTYSGYEPTTKWIEKFSDRRGQAYFTIEEKKTKEVIGFIGIDLQEQPATGWVDYYIFKEYRNRGYCREAITALVKKALNGKLYVPSIESELISVYIRKALKLNAIRAWVSELNTPSIKTLESCKFSHEATFHKTIYKKDIGWIDKHIYYLLKGE